MLPASTICGRCDWENVLATRWRGGAEAVDGGPLRTHVKIAVEAGRLGPDGFPDTERGVIRI